MSEKIFEFIHARKIAVMGGTFDPIHYGHLVIAEAVRHQYGIERIIFIPSGNPAHKAYTRVTGREHRFFMTVLATAGNPNFFVSRIEIDRPGSTYTVDTIDYLKKVCSKSTQIYFITGADAVEQILTWKDAQRLLGLCDFIAVTRPGFHPDELFSHISALNEKFKSKLHFMQAPSLAISSTDIRMRMIAGYPVKYLMPEIVEDYIYKHQLYGLNEKEFDISSMDQYVREGLSEQRYRHTVGVAWEAMKLAQKHGENIKTAYVAGLLHDCAKEIPEDEKRKRCREYGIHLDKVMRKQIDLVHGYLAAQLATIKFNIQDEDLLNAISYHTTGRPDMSLLEKIILTADMIEPHRKHVEQSLRELAYKNIDRAVAICLQNKISYSRTKGRSVHPLGLEALQYYSKKITE